MVFASAIQTILPFILLGTSVAQTDPPVGDPFTVAVTFTSWDTLDSVIGFAEVPAKSWDFQFETLEQEFTCDLVQTIVVEVPIQVPGAPAAYWEVLNVQSHNPPFTHIGWDSRLSNANFSSAQPYTVASAPITVPSNTTYELKRSITLSCVGQMFNFLPIPSSGPKPSVCRVGNSLDEIDLKIKLTPHGPPPQGGGPGGGQS